MLVLQSQEDAIAIKLIAIDMDGTLLNHKHEITPAAKEAIAAASSKGVYVVLATGRLYIGIERYLIELDLQVEGNFCITNNGALVQQTVKKSCISQTLLDINDYRFPSALSQQLDVHFHVLNFDTLYTEKPDIRRYTVYEASLTGMPFKFCTIAKIDASLRFQKVMMTDEHDILDAAIKSIPQEAF